jgi:hypothetical protein
LTDVLVFSFPAIGLSSLLLGECFIAIIFIGLSEWRALINADLSDNHPSAMRYKGNGTTPQGANDSAISS